MLPGCAIVRMPHSSHRGRHSNVERTRTRRSQSTASQTLTGNNGGSVRKVQAEIRPLCVWCTSRYQDRSKRAKPFATRYHNKNLCLASGLQRRRRLFWYNPSHSHASNSRWCLGISVQVVLLSVKAYIFAVVWPLGSLPLAQSKPGPHLTGTGDNRVGVMESGPTSASHARGPSVDAAAHAASCSKARHGLAPLGLASPLGPATSKLLLLAREALAL